LKRLLGTGGGIIFKGSGFYQTDYRSSSYQAGAKADGGSSSAPPAKSGD
jgi:predicted nucleic acid-binding Zn ribbon protein